MKNGKGIFPSWLWLATLFSIGLLAPQLASAASGPSITSQPASQSLLLGTNATFSVVASGQGTLLYQWTLNGTNLTDSPHLNGSTNDTLTISNLFAGDDGNYQVIVSNSHGSVTSSNATLIVLFPAAITSQPTNQSVVLSSNASFAVTVIGTAPLNYQWLFNGSPLVNSGRISGSTTTNLDITDVQTNDAGSYQLVVTNDYGAVTSSVATLAVLLPPFVTLQPTNQVALIGETVAFSALANSTEPLVYQWQRDGTNLAEEGNVSGTAGTTLTISDVQMNDFGNYRLVISNEYGTAVSSDSALAVLPIVAWGLNAFGQTQIPLIATNVMAIAGGGNHSLALGSKGAIIAWGYDGNGQIDIPAGLTDAMAISAGFSHNLALKSNGTVAGWGDNTFGQTNVPNGLTSVVAIAAGGGHSLALKSDETVVGWGRNLEGEVTLPAGLSNVIAIAAGDYHSVALKDNGTVVSWGDNYWGQTNVPEGLSNIVAIAAGEFHNLALKSDGTVVGWGYDHSGQAVPPVGLSNVVSISGGYAYSMALKSDGTLVCWGDNSSGQTNTPAGLSNFVAIAAGAYHSMAMVADPATQLSPKIEWQGSTNRTVPMGKTTVFNPILLGSLPMSFQWYLNGAPLTGETNKWLVLSSIQPDQAGEYQFIAANNYGFVTSQVAIVTESPSIVTPPFSQSLLLGSNAVFTGIAAGSGPLSYQWLLNGNPLADNGHVSGATTTNLNIVNLQINDAGIYQLVATNAYGSVTSAPAVLTLLIPTEILAQPLDQVALMSHNTSFSVSATGTAPLSCRWYFNGSPLFDNNRIIGSATTNLIILNVQTNDAGSYQLAITNNYGSTNSQVAQLSVVIAPLITVQPTSQVVSVSAATSLSVQADGTGPLIYEWFFNGSPLTDSGHVSGSDSPKLSIASAAFSDAGLYRVMVTNIYGTSTSSTAILRVTTGVPGAVHFVDLHSTNPVAPYTDWSTASTNIQTAINVSSSAANDAILVAPGSYLESLNFNGKPVWLSSASGAASTSVYPPSGTTITFNNGETSNSILSGLTILNGGISVSASSSPIIVSNSILYCATGINCYFSSPLILNNEILNGGTGINLQGADNAVVVGNTIRDNSSGISLFAAGTPTIANNIIAYNNGTAISMVNRSDANIVQNIIARNSGDGINALVPSGARGPWIINNTIYGNGGNGIYESGFISTSAIFNNIVEGNYALSVDPWYGGNPPIIKFNDFYTTNGIIFAGVTNVTNHNGNLSTDPHFVSPLALNFRLQTNSPCINAGNNTYVADTNDLDGNPRIVGGTVDIGAYEYQSLASVISYAWLQQYGLPTDGSVDNTNLNGTGFSVYQDWIAGLDPTNPASVLALQTPAATNNSSGIIVTWQSVSGITYYLQRSSDLTQPFTTIQSNLVGQAGTTSYTDTSATNDGPYFYRVGVQ